MNFAAWLPLFAAFIALTAASLVHLIARPVPYMPKWAWALLVVFTIPIGSILYFVVVFGIGVQREDAEGRHVE